MAFRKPEARWCHGRRAAIPAGAAPTPIMWCSGGAIAPTMSILDNDYEDSHDSFQSNLREFDHLLPLLPGILFQLEYDRDKDRFVPRLIGDRAEDILGYAPGFLTGAENLAQTLLFSDDQANLYEALKAALTSREPQTMRCRMRAASGEARWMELRVVAMDEPSAQKPRLLGFSFDITEQRLNEEALRAREANARAIADNSPDLIVRVDRNLRIKFANKSHEKLINRSPSDILNKTIFEVGMTPEMTAIISDHCLAAFDTGKPVQFEHSIDLPEERRFLEFRAIPEFDADGQCHTLLCITRDITSVHLARLEQERLTEVLIQERQRLNVVLRQMPAGVLILDTNGRLEMANEVARNQLNSLRCTRASESDISLAPDIRVEDGQDVPVIWPITEALETGQFVRSREVPVWRQDGTYAWLRVGASPVRDRDGRLVGVVSVIHDLTDLKQVERSQRFLAEAGVRLAESLDREETLSVIARLAVPQFADWCTVDVVDPNGSFRRVAACHAVDSLNQVMQNITPAHSVEGTPQPYGLRSVAASGRTQWFVEPPDDLVDYLEHHRDQLALIETLGLQSYICAPMISRDRVLGSISFVMGHSGRRFTMRDVTLAEEIARRAAQALDNAQLHGEVLRADRIKQEFLAALGHELRNPLAAITAGILNLQLDEELDAQARKTVDALDRQTRHVARILDELMDTSRVTMGRARLKKADLDLRDIIRGAIEMMSHQAKVAEHNITVTMCEESLNVLGDEIRLRQVFANLLDNAIKYTPAAGRICVTAVREDGEAVVRIQDNGIGIPVEEMGSVFDLFAQGHNTDLSHAGLGVGLPLTKTLVEAHNGTVRVFSEGVDRGTEVVVRLPLSEPSQVAETIEPYGVSAKRRVLVVDDNADTADAIQDLLRHWGHEVRTANTGAEAELAAAEFQPTAVVMDIGLPDTDGRVLAAKLRVMGNGTVERIIGMSGYDPQDGDKNSPFDAYLIKPAPYDRLRRLLET